MEDLLPKTGYRARIMNAVKHDKNHPVNNGVKMQAHHLVSAKGVQLAGMGQKLAALGYEINVLENLILLPSTLQGACYLRVQLHRSDHSYHDDEHPRSYHEEVKVRLQKLVDFLKSCEGCDGYDQEKNRKKLQSKIDKVSGKIAEAIGEFEVPLTRIFFHFNENSRVGCGNSDTIDGHKGHECSVERMHRNHNSVWQKNENITFNISGRYRLRVGR
jgi:hypothetical protein